MARRAARISLVTCRQLPEPDPDADLLVDSLLAAGIDARWTAWDDPDAQWEPVAFLRSPWNYAHRLPEFLAWAGAYRGRLVNPPDVVRWNSHKGYLLELAARAIPTVPTALVAHGTASPDLHALAERFQTRDLVIKPAVSAGSFRTFRSGGDLDRVQAEYAALVRDRDTLVQPYAPAVESYGEHALVVLDGEVTHAVRKSPRFSGDVERVTPVPVTQEEADFARRVLAALPWELPYGRIDVTRLADGSLALMELELIEPSLFLATSTEGLWRFVDVVTKVVFGRSRHEGGLEA